MSKAAKKSIFILIALLVAALGFAGVSFFDLQDTKTKKGQVEQELSRVQDQFTRKQKENIARTKKLQAEIDKARSAKNEIDKKIKKIEKGAEKQSREMQAKIDTVTDERDRWKRRIESIRQERDDLMGKIGDLTKKLEEKPKVIYKEREPQSGKIVKRPPADVKRAPSVSPVSGKAVDEQYWANLLKERASLEVKIQELEENLSKKSVAVVEMRQSNEDLNFEVETLKREKEEIMSTIQHKEDMIDNISLELARTKNDKKFIADRLGKLNEENKEIHREMKKLVSVKNALEKSVVRVIQEKEKIEGSLGRSETLIQSKIDEIWDIKDEIDRSIKSMQVGGSSANEVELPPIIVSSAGDDGATYFDTGEAPPAMHGKVISVNEGNNFVIINIGEGSGIQPGDALSVYRDSKYIARLEVIQVRNDISAADLKDQWSKIKVGDVVR